MPKDESKQRKRMVVEEVGTPDEAVIGAPAMTQPAEEIKEKVEELHDITQDIGQSVEKSEEIQEQLAQAAEKVETPVDKPKTEFVSVRPSSGPNPLFILIPGVLLLGALLGGVYFYEKGVSSSAPSTPTPEATIEASPASSIVPSASPSAKLDLTKFPINVQNGSGIPGTAGSAKDLLTKAGFKVGTTGNADNYNYTDTVVKAKSDVPADFLTKLNNALSSVYSLGKTQTLDASSKDEVVVIIGNSKAQ